MELLYYTLRGSGRTRIWLHGLLGNNLNLQALSKDIPGQHIFLDMRNHGKSFHNNDCSYTTMAQDVINVMNSLHIQEADLIGHSMGGKTSIVTACMFPERVKSAVIMDIAPLDYTIHLKNYAEDIRFYLKTMKELNLKGKNRKQLMDEMGQSIKDYKVVALLTTNLIAERSEFSWRVGVEELNIGYDQIASFPVINSKYSGPTLALMGENSSHTCRSPAISTEGIDGLYQKYFNNAILKIIKESGHWIHVEKFEDTHAEIKSFLNSLD
jgi:esterase